ncbi:MAG: peptidoglycan-binding protein [Clostridia bacterium]|nr:peptidoglycan-binding protein [Clostridia bacterium]MDD4376095.1 peptidoglycan-binding protein [Clostridia bacterium]
MMKYNNYINKSSMKRQENIGKLQVLVYHENLGEPLEGVDVLVRTENSRQEMHLTTNSIGQTEIIDLPAPPIEYSMEPSDNRPYTEYDIIIRKEGYKDVIINNAQIFPDTIAEQEIFLTKLNEVEIEEINIQKPVLWGDYPEKIEEEEIKPLPEQTGFVVLPEPVIPETIIVHAGVPNNSSAKNYYVSFKQYIKNVACCEVYSNWPKEALKANILAIISFTLNRVYTEWYRSKGYNFTITNSTAYDQAFDYGRTIYKEVNQIVEELFTTYIGKIGYKQPILTQYCDGQKSKCPNWMSQWGSKSLADNGRSHVEILKTYYGSNIVIKAAKKVSGVPKSYPGYEVKKGSSGANVRTIQEQLNGISKNYPLIGKLKVDGIFGSKTEEAVKTFQKVFGLPQTGVVDMKTWYKISQIYVAVEKLVY